MEQNTKDAQRLAVVEEQIKNLVNVVTTLSTDLRNWQQNYVPRQELDERFKAVYQDIQEVKDDLKDAATSKDITEIKQALTEMRNDKRSNKALYAAWGGVIVAAAALLSKFI